jgi:hypothetical protein
MFGEELPEIAIFVIGVENEGIEWIISGSRTEIS